LWTARGFPAIVANDNFEVIYAMRIFVLALEGVFDTGLAVLLDAFATANGLGHTLAGSPQFDVSVVGTRRRVRSARGMQIPVEPIRTGHVPDCAIVAALSTKTPELLAASLRRPDVVEAKAQLLAWHAEGATVAASCIGTFLLADTGLLNGRPATTTWWLSTLFRQRFPEVQLDESRMLIPAGNRLITAGAAMGHLDLALWLIGQASPELASIVARYLLADIRSSQAPYIIPGHLARTDPLIERFEQWARSQLSVGFSLQQAAKALATSPRTLQRRTEAVLGKSPLAYFQDLRVEHAQNLVRSSRLDLDAIAAEVGYVDGATLRTLLRRRLGRGVRELRADLR
jgi:transcriptional regulator GlxA family with amidase domain